MMIIKKDGKIYIYGKNIKENGDNYRKVEVLCDMGDSANIKKWVLDKMRDVILVVVIWHAIILEIIAHTSFF